MGNLSSKYKRIFLRNIAWSAEDNAVSLSLALKQAAQSRLKSSSSGLYLTGTSANGASVNYSIPPSGDATPTSIAELCGELIDLFEAVKAAHSDADDETLLRYMLNRIVSVKSYCSNFGGLVR